MLKSSWQRLPLLARLFLTSVVLNYPWEIGQAFLYVDMDYSAATWWHCFVASLGDGILVGLIYGAGYLVTGRDDWFTQRGGRPWGITLVTGLTLGVVVEWVAVHQLGRWAYTAAMPLVTGLDIGWVPVLQMLLLPLLIFFILAKTARAQTE